MKGTFQKTFLTGMLIILPVLVTIWVVSLMFGLLNQTVTPLILNVLKLVTLAPLSETTWVQYVAPVVSVTLSVLFIYILGLVGGNVLGRQLLGAVDRWLKRIPFVRGIYSATRQFVDTFQSGSGAFSHAVVIEYPRTGCYTLAFVTNTKRGEVHERTGKKLVAVFVPTTPNPTSGFLLFVPEDQLIRLHMSVDDAFKMIVSGGVLTPESQPPVAAPPAAPAN
ncbi:MAG: DUF502 domain-containing protein [Deltaproteobacteria bacterium]|nr:DUF502 domain-containing protein [Deltaproteobacteria bacterium]